MTEQYEGAVEAFVGKQNGGELTPRIVYEFVKALNADGKARHAETLAEIGELRKIVGGRAEAIEQAKRDVLECIEMREHWPVLDKMAAELRAEMMAAQSARRNADPPTADYRDTRNMNDPGDDQFTETRESAFPASDKKTLGQVLVSFSIVKWAVTIAIGALIVFSVTYGADRLASAKAENTEQHQELLMTEEEQHAAIKAAVLEALRGMQVTPSPSATSAP